MKDKNKGFMTVLVIFAVIGVIAILGFGVFGVYSLVEKINSDDAVTGNVTTVKLDDQEVNDEVVAASQETLTADTNNDASAEGTGANGETDTGTTDFVIVQNEEATNVEDVSVYDDGKFTVVFLGDSILDNFRDETGICALVGDAINANVYNLGVGGMPASSDIGEDPYAPFEEGGLGINVSGYMMTEMLLGTRSFDYLRDCTAKSIMMNNLESIKNADVFVVEYGLNDFMKGRRTADDSDDTYNRTTYLGAMHVILDNLKKLNPDCKIIFCELSYFEFYRADGSFIGNSYSMNNGPGTGVNYSQKLESLKSMYGDSSIYIFGLDRQGIDENNVESTTIDHLHLNEEGRAIYAENLVDFMREQGLAE